MKPLVPLALILMTSSVYGLTVEFTTDTVTIGAISPGSAIAWNAVLVEPYNSNILRTPSRGIATDDDLDGIVVLRPERGVPRASVWAIADLASGGYGVWSPTPEFLVEFRLDPAFRSLAKPTVRHGWITALIARPGVGAWVREMKEGTGRDADRSFNGRLTMDPESFEPLMAGLGPPRGIRARDVVILLDWETLEFAIAELGGGR